MSEIFHPAGPSGMSMQPLVDFAIAGGVGATPVILLLKEANLVVALLSGIVGLAIGVIRICLLVRAARERKS